MAPLVLGRSEEEALRDYQGAIQDALSAFAGNVYLARLGVQPGSKARLLTLADDVIELRDASSRVHLALSMELHYRSIQLPLAEGQGRRRWTIETAAYIYRLEMPGAPAQEIVGYHWHPHVAGIAFPHVHPLIAGGAGRRLHIAISHVTLKEVLTFAMRDYEVVPISAFWEAALDRSDRVLRSTVP